MSLGMSRSTFDRAGYAGGGGGVGGGYAGGGGGYAAGNSGGYAAGGYSGGGYNYGPPAAPAGGGGWFDLNALKSADNSAALSALTLLSFLFFLNMLQNQLLSTGSQTLFVSLGSPTGNTTGFGRIRRDVMDEDVWGRDFQSEVSEYSRRVQEEFWINDEDEESIGADSGAGRKSTGKATPVKNLNFKGEVGSDWEEVSSELLALLPSSPPNLAVLFSRCRITVACTLQSVTPSLAPEAVRTIIAASDGCNTTLEDNECTELSRLLKKLVYSKEDQHHMKNDPHDL